MFAVVNVVVITVPSNAFMAAVSVAVWAGRVEMTGDRKGVQACLLCNGWCRSEQL